MILDPRRVFTINAAFFLLLLTLLLSISHARPQSDPCADELLMRWNEFATNANDHMHTYEADPKKRAKTHSKLDREWEAIHALACW